MASESHHFHALAQFSNSLEPGYWHRGSVHAGATGDVQRMGALQPDEAAQIAELRTASEHDDVPRLGLGGRACLLQLLVRQRRSRHTSSISDDNLLQHDCIQLRRHAARADSLALAKGLLLRGQVERERLCLEPSLDFHLRFELQHTARGVTADLADGIAALQNGPQSTTDTE